MQDTHTALNTTVTRVQLFAIVSFCAIMFLLVLLLRAIDGQQTPQVITGAHGIETSWPSAFGDSRLWSFAHGARGDRSWIEEHVETLKAAQEAMPVARR